MAKTSQHEYEEYIDCEEVLTFEHWDNPREIASGRDVDIREFLTEKFGGHEDDWVKYSDRLCKTHEQKGDFYELHWFHNYDEEVGNQMCKKVMNKLIRRRCVKQMRLNLC